MKLEIKTPFEVDAGMRMNVFMEGRGLEMNGVKYVPDATKGYIEFYLAHPFPVVSARGKALHVGTVASSYQSMRHQGLNFEHRVATYEQDPEKRKNAEDRYIGSVLDVEFPTTPFGGWRLADMMSGKQEVPSIRGIANVFKQAKGVDRFLGEHQSGRHRWTVSLEVNFSSRASSVILMPNGSSNSEDRNPKLGKEMNDAAIAGTPSDWEGTDCWNIPVDEASDEILNCWSEKEERFTKPYRGRQCVLMMGGINKDVHFKGTGVVRYGAEPTAAMGTVVASGVDPKVAAAAGRLVAALEKFRGVIAG